MTVGVLLKAIEIYEVILIIRIFMSWMHPDPNHPLVSLIINITDPILVPVRDVVMRIFPGLRNIGLDISPIAVFILLGFVRQMIIGSYGHYGY